MSTTHTDKYPDSWYHASTVLLDDQPMLTQASPTDVCIIGAGITGLTAAIELAERGYNVTVLEAKRIAWGASGRSGGQVIFGYGCDMPVIEKQAGMNAAKAMWDMSVEGMNLIHQRIAKYDIDCDFRQGHLHAAIKPRHMDELTEWQHDLEATYGYFSLSLWQQSRLHQELHSERYIGGLYDRNSGHLHPLKYTLGLARAALKLGVDIFEQSPVTKHQQISTGHILVTPQGQVTAKSVIYATNAYLAGLQPYLQRRVMPVGTYIAASEPLGESLARDLISNDMAVADMNYVLDYFRLSSDHRILFGGRVSYTTIDPSDLKQTMLQRMTKVFPQLQGKRVDYEWGGHIGITVNRAPHFGHLGNNVFYAQGFSGHGIAATNIAGTLMAEAAAGQQERLDVFSDIKHMPFPGGKWLRIPALVLATTWYRLRDFL